MPLEMNMSLGMNMSLSLGMNMSLGMDMSLGGIINRFVEALPSRTHYWPRLPYDRMIMLPSP